MILHRRNVNMLLLFHPMENGSRMLHGKMQKADIVWKTAADGSGTPQKLTQRAGHYANPEWSRKGDKIAIIQGSGLEFRGRQPEEENFFEIRWLPAEGGDPEYITSIRQAPGTVSIHKHSGTWMDTRVYFAMSFLQQNRTDDPKNELVSIRIGWHR